MAEDIDKEINASAVAYFSIEAPVYSKLAEREAITISVARIARDTQFPEQRCHEYMWEYWNPRCEPPWERESELRNRVRIGYSTNNQLSSLDQGTDPNPDWVREMNEKYFVVNVSGKVQIFSPTYDQALKRNVLELFSFEDLKRLFSNDRIEVGRGRNGQPNYITRAEAWLTHPQRRQYPGGVTFAPGEKVSAGVFNLWRGFAIPPKKGDWSRLHTHICDVICAGNKASSEYLLNWMARLFQMPGEQGRVAVVLRGGRGTGKGTLGNFILELVGQHGLYITHAKHLVGNFNAHLRDAVFVFADEAFYAGDKQHESVLKGLITDPYLTIEAKHQNAVTARNVTHILMASNENWVIPAGVDERRFFVLDVSEHNQKNTEYFRALRQEAAEGGLAAMLHDLLERDISGFDVDGIPQTEALAEQKIQSLRGPHAWLFEALNQGRISCTEWNETGISIPKDDAYQDYERFSKRQNEYRPANRTQWAKQIKAILHPLEARPRKNNAGRERTWEFGPLSASRELFMQFLRISSIDWEQALDAGAPSTTGVENKEADNDLSF